MGFILGMILGMIVGVFLMAWGVSSMSTNLLDSSNINGFRLRWVNKNGKFATKEQLTSRGK